MKKICLFLILLAIFLSINISDFDKKEVKAACIAKCNQHWGFPAGDGKCVGSQPYWDAGALTTGACAVRVGGSVEYQ